MKSCTVCQTTETNKWYLGPICKSCYNKQYIKENRLKMNSLRKRWMKQNPDKKKSYEASFILKHKDKYLISQKEREAYHRAVKKQATPPWLTKEHRSQIKDIYQTCPKGYHVDHIVPLKSDFVCGLHVPWNLQHLPAKENLSKSNNFNP